jgi:hypothetical protein
MGRPLEAGTYYVGVYNSSDTTINTCVIDSRGIGAGQTYPVTSLDYDGGTTQFSGLAPREARYFKVNVPANSPSWELLLNLSGTEEAEMVVRRGTIPDFAAAQSGEIYDAGRGVEVEMKKLGPERYVLLPFSGQSLIPEGDYYIAVVGEGAGATGGIVGTGTCSGVLKSVGPLLVTELGMASDTPISHPVSLVAGQIKAYHFDVPDDTNSLEVRLDNREFAPGLAVVYSPQLPKPPTDYGIDGGIVVPAITGGDADSLIYTISNPPAGKWSLVVNAGTVSAASATLVIKALGVLPVAFDGGTAVVEGHEPGTVRYFSVNVPAGAEGWDIRMRDVTGPVPVMSIRRDFFTGPPNAITPGWPYWTFTNWPSGNQTQGGTDWTGYAFNGAAAVAPRLVTGMGRPLEAGKYYIGVLNGSSTTAINYTIDSRGIGSGLTYPVATLDFATGTANINDLAPREAKYFKVDIGPNTPTWEVTLSASAGDLELLARQGAIPDFAATTVGSAYGQNYGVEVEMKKTGPERYALLAPLGADFIPPGVYYLAVVSEGAGAAGSIIGTGTSSGVITSAALPIKDLGVANASGTTELVELVGAQMKAYGFTVPAGTDSLEVRLDGIQGNSWVSLIQGTRLPKAPGEPISGNPAIGASPHNDYGCDGGQVGVASTRILTAANPAPGEWRVVVRAGHSAAPSYAFTSAEATLVVTALSTVPVAYNGGTFAVNGQEPGTWRYFVVNVPADASGWDIRLRDVSGPLPAMMVRRDSLPAVPANLIPGFIPPGWQPWASTSWPTDNQWLAGLDWTGYQLNSGGVSAPPRIVAGMGRPLEAGTYFIGVYNNTISSTSYTIDSRGIGAGYIYPVTTLDFAGGTATITDLPGREARYFKVSIPPSTPSWEVTLAPTVGEVEMIARSGTIPDFAALRQGNVYGPDAQVEMKKAGPDRYVLLPNLNTDVLVAGDYYLAVVSEGINPTGSTIGTGNSSGVVTSVGAVTVSNLGTATTGGITEPATLSGGQIKAYQFSVAPGTQSLEMRLANTVGYPAMSIVQGTRLPIPPGLPPLGASPHSDYGFDGGTAGTPTTNIHTLVNPTPGLWTLLVRARHDPVVPAQADALFPDAAADVLIRSKPNLPLNFAEELNGGGGSHTDTRQAIDGEYNIYEVAVPSNLGGQPILGWIIHTQVFQGAVSLEVYKNAANPASGITIPTGVAIVVPPFLTFNETWYVRVKATGLTQYKVTSRPVTLERPAWQMANDHNLTFGDSGSDGAGNPLPGDRGVDLEEGYWHFYAVDVPDDNKGLLRTELQGISGNPDLYIREDGVPTIHHLSGGKGGSSLAPRVLTGSTTSYGNWVPLNGRTENRLRPGRWYFGVRAGGNSNARYRVIFSTGNVKELALNPGTATAQVPNSVTEHSLADNDWRYYRFSIPEAAPTNWTLTFSQQVGDVVMWLRDTVPPGQTNANTNLAGNIANWASATDSKNQGPYQNGYNLGGQYAVTTPPLRPGNTYYVGFRSNNSATFSLSSDTSGGPINVVSSLDFYTGTLSTTVPANGSLVYQIPVPAEGTRFKYTSTHSTAINVRIEQGTLPASSGGQHFSSGAANSSLNQALSSTLWPWQPNHRYYVRFVNNSGVDQPLTFTLNGKNALTEDEDADGLLDAWERQYFNGLTQGAAGDPDNDGVTNAVEFADGTIPNDANSAKYTLTVLARNGSASALPVQAKYDKGTVVTLTNVPNAGYDFVGWSGGPYKGDDFALRATGTVTIPTGGVWTFGINAADGARLKINGTAVISDGALHDARDTFGQITLAAGTHAIEIVAFEYRVGEGLEFFAAPGSFTSFGPEFRLVGDVANGGLAVQNDG